ncbi:beige/beach-related [Anaeramoeba flamelloides]|uniref:Beige/beach-related n=1 Tax=Anaeramoeba flamelloides TaxID=1746091 RepID=A0ABQ8Z8E4_9EUKA|nr:beige/beach-related [Anaeramoeba flamelloides]
MNMFIGDNNLDNEFEKLNLELKSIEENYHDNLNLLKQNFYEKKMKIKKKIFKFDYNFYIKYFINKKIDNIFVNQILNNSSDNNDNSIYNSDNNNDHDNYLHNKKKEKFELKQRFYKNLNKKQKNFQNKFEGFNDKIEYKKNETSRLWKKISESLTNKRGLWEINEKKKKSYYKLSSFIDLNNQRIKLKKSGLFWRS